ncbi:hypothetical protein C1645_817883 [Glomus cerebriforme]|uniref:Uncharacterized protein n=1 Tax=Glomus cerebriforme TaxID=658196 RepID=A0A397TDW3_9GLOM|nr:hypothetical protein C1645_817883 [Glomus cerebriforme]
MENVDIPDINMFCVWKVQISFNEKKSSGMVNNKLVIIVIIPNETQVCLPVTFEASDPQAYHKILKPGHSEGTKNACTLVVFSQKRDMKKFILTVGHAVEEVYNKPFNWDSNLLDYAFCEVDRVPVDDPNKPFDSNGWINNLLKQGLSTISALLVYGVDQPFDEFGDSDSAVFDDDGQLWEIYYRFEYPYHFIVPIHLILNDIQKKYEINLILIA